ELEHLLLARRAPAPRAVVPIEPLEAELEQLLRRGGARESAVEISAALAAAARPGAGLGPLLDQLAFATDVGLDAARRLLAALGLGEARPAAGPARAGVEPLTPDEADAAPGLGERLARALDQGLAQQRDVDELFSQLEAMAGIRPEGDDETPAGSGDELDDGGVRETGGRARGEGAHGAAGYG